MRQSLAQTIAGVRILQPLKLRDFRFLFAGQTVSLFGDQFYLVALPLLALDLTGSGAALGAVLMVGGISRAFFDLVGGAVTDRISHRSILLVSNLARALVAASITTIAFLRLAKLWHLYLLSVSFGIVDAFFFPAFVAVIPSLVKPEQLNAGNALIRGSARLMGGIGPAAAGLLITGLTAGAAIQTADADAPGGRRFAAAFAIDTATFVFAAVTVWLMTERRSLAPADREQPDQHLRQGIRGLLLSIGEGLVYSWRDPLIRALLLFVVAVEFSFIGPSTVGLAVLAKSHFAAAPNAEGAGAYAAMLSAFGFGMLSGVLVAGSIKMPRRRGPLVLSSMLLLGVGIAALGYLPNLWTACLIVCLIGLAGGSVSIMLLAWIQSRSAPGMLGRVISLLMFGTSLVEPLSYALSGVMADVSLKLLFVASGAVALIAAIGAIFSRAITTSD